MKSAILSLVVALFVLGQTDAAVIVWQDEGARTIFRANSDGTDVVDIISMEYGGTGLAVDFTHEKVYWTNATEGHFIQRADLDGSNIEDLVTTGLGTPEGIALDVAGGKMYWADQGPAKISRANLDGTDLEVLATLHPTPGSPSPRGLAVDGINGKIYWCSQGYGTIQRADLDGSNIEDLVTIAGWNGPDGIALDIEAGKMYWTGLNEILKIQRANLDGSDVEDLVTTGLVIPRGIDVGTVVPEPSILTLLAVGAVGLLSCVRRKRTILESARSDS